MPFRLCWFDFGVHFFGVCAIRMSSVQLRVHWWMIWWVMNDCNVKAHVRVLICVYERRDSWMALTPCCGSCIPQPRFKPHALACFARLESRFCLWWRWWSWWLQHVHCWRRVYVTARLSCIYVICICLDVLQVLNCDAGMFTFVRIVMHANAWMICLCLIGYVPSHLNICMLCIALLVKRCSWLWRYGDDGSCLRKYPEILFKQYFGSYSAASEHPPSFFCKIIFPFVVLNVGCLFAFVMRLNNIFEFTGNDCN